MEISGKILGPLGHLHFDAFNGAMDLEHCQRLLTAYQELAETPQVKVILLWGGEDFFSNGIDLVSIDQQYNPAILAYKNLRGLNGLIRAILSTPDKLVLAALGGPAAAGGVMLALACDLRYARAGLVLNPHYVNMGLSGSEFFSLLLPRAVGQGWAEKLLYEAQPISAELACRIGLLHGEIDGASFEKEITERAAFLAENNLQARLATKRLLNRGLLERLDEAEQAELRAMKDCCNEPEFNEARRAFIKKEASPQFANIATKGPRGT
ncbi:MAG: enoyl-CoA hydratase-related protein [bacterium]|nr:enoyl-CoA hydratase-related protein [bacterium]